MGKPSKKRSKEKKEKWKFESGKIAQSQKLVADANEIADPMTLIEPFRKFDRNGLTINISCEWAAKMDVKCRDWAINLTRKNMKELYEACEWGWNDKAKKSEMEEDAARYLIARDEKGDPQACVHFRFDLDDDIEVVYCYEIQLEESVRRKGLGKFLMQILELLALKTGMKKVVATVLKHHVVSKSFFEKLKYQLDDTNPDDQISSVVNNVEYCYIIVSKIIPVKKA
ncbi:DgyrCDS2831 [Dimorphilus gyrociliatus]|uniref:N-alpha-acetyltransferase 40 n=1 Tax=Dimorphilus gyrociliatus TaxID=2664684 RepID=A0A7I8VE59_9ANNE|nr:DgyrCDS2831 [Dimorphilus gyrociliatus]